MTQRVAPRIVVLGGPNGAGKSTAAPRLLWGVFGVREFLNADLIARGISPFEPERAALAASEVLLNLMDRLARQRISFGLESTLAARSLAPRIRELVAHGYEFNLIFIWLSSADLAVARVANRVRMGGHSVPESTVRRRYSAGLQNFFRLYQPIANRWQMYNGEGPGSPRIIASGRGSIAVRMYSKPIWSNIVRERS